MCHPGRPLPHGLSKPKRVRTGRLPQREVERVLLHVGRALGEALARARAEVVEVATRELAVAGEVADGEVDVLALRGLGDVRVALLDELLDDVDDAVDRRRDARHRGGLGAADRREVRVRELAHPLREGEGIFAPLLRAVHDLVVDVGDVLAMADLESARAEEAHEDVERGVRPTVARVGEVVHGDAADVELHLPRRVGDEVLDFLRESIVEAHRHRAGEITSISRPGGAI